jgi:uroporphyrinogen III methyltransferase / synthase
MNSGGWVALVGAGPGDPGLITVRGRELLAMADAVVIDRLGTEALVALFRPAARVIDAGKSPGRQALTQDEINALLVELAGQGLGVVRLKGGDPFVFGRGGEEAMAVHAAGIPLEVVPGITSSIAAPGAAGIPVTHRAVATSFTVVTGHEDPTKPSEQTDWAALAATPGTLVILMGMGRLAAIAARLIAAGRPADQPAAVVQWGTLPRQRSVIATLGTIADAVTAAGLGNPAVVVVGDVASLGPEIDWRGRRPLTGRSVVVTRARAQASDLRRRLEELGAEVIELPVIRIAPIADPPGLEGVLDRLGDYRMVVLTSVNGVEAFVALLAARGRDVRAIHQDARIVAIGPATAARLEAAGLRPDLVPDEFVAEGILAALADDDLAGVPVLVARARGARPTLIEGLAGRGARVDELELYEAVADDPDETQIQRALEADFVTFTASSTVIRFVGIVGPGRAAGMTGRAISIGPVTSATLRDASIPVSAEADPYTIPGLVDAVLRVAEQESR